MLRLVSPQNVSRLVTPFLIALAFLGLATADETETPSWQLGISQWSGDAYEMPHLPPVTDPLLDPPNNALPYTMPFDPKTNAVPTPGQPVTSTPVFEMPHAPPSATALSNIPLPPESPTALDPTLGNVAPTPIGNIDDSNDAFVSAPPIGQTFSDPILGDAVVGDASPNNGTPPQAVEVLPDPANDPLLSQQPTDDPPLQDEVVRWYDYPRRWMRGWDSHAEFGIDGSDGNAVTLALQTGLELKRKSERSTLAVDIDYRKATNRNATVEDNGRFNIDYDYLFADSPWSGFAKYGMEWDRFKAFDLRLNLNGGIGYFWIRDDRTTFVTRLGAGASQEIGAPIDDWIAEAVFGLEAERQLTERQKIKGKVDYFPAWEDFDDFRVVTDLSWEILLDGSENLSLKLAATDRYDSTPQGAEPNDIYYSMLLLYKF